MRIIEKALYVGISYDRALYTMSPGDVIQLWLFRMEREAKRICLQ